MQKERARGGGGSFGYVAGQGPGGLVLFDHQT